MRKKRPAAPSKRLNLILSERAYEDLATIAAENRRSMTEIVRVGLGLVRYALEAERNGHRLIVARNSKNGNESVEAIKELVLP